MFRQENFWHGGWTELVGVAYERRIYAFRFNTTEAQDDAFIAKMNGAENRSHFQLLFSNCSDFARVILNEYFPGTFKRSIFPDAGMTTPKQITYKLVRYAKKHPETQLTVFEIPQIPGYRRSSQSNKSICGVAHHNRLCDPDCDCESLSCGRAVCGLPGPRALSPDSQASGDPGAGQSCGVDSAGRARRESGERSGTGPTRRCGTALRRCRRPQPILA